MCIEINICVVAVELLVGIVIKQVIRVWNKRMREKKIHYIERWEQCSSHLWCLLIYWFIFMIHTDIFIYILIYLLWYYVLWMLWPNYSQSHKSEFYSVITNCCLRAARWPKISILLSIIKDVDLSQKISGGFLEAKYHLKHGSGIYPLRCQASISYSSPVSVPNWPNIVASDLTSQNPYFSHPYRQIF